MHPKIVDEVILGFKYFWIVCDVIVFSIVEVAPLVRRNICRFAVQFGRSCLERMIFRARLAPCLSVGMHDIRPQRRDNFEEPARFSQCGISW